MEQTKEFLQQRTRLRLKLPIQVVCRETPDYQWTEKSSLIDVSHFGAGFTLTRPIDVGRLIKITIPLPHQMRCFDHSEPMYSVWSVVRHATPMPSPDRSKPSLFRIGVGFVGKEPPLSYALDPTIRYEPLLVNVPRTTLWMLGRHLPAEQRREPRLNIPLEVLLEALDGSGRAVLWEHVVTETISSLGACIPTNLDVGVGRILRVTSAKNWVSIYAAIRSRIVAADGLARLGVEFIDGRWPLQSLEAARQSHQRETSSESILRP